MGARPLVAVAVLAVFLSGCEDPVGPGSGTVHAGLDAEGLRVENRTTATVFYFVLEGSVAVRANWALCVDPASCPYLERGESVKIGYDRIFGWTPESTGVVVYWWYAVFRRGGDPEPDSIRSLWVST